MPDDPRLPADVRAVIDRIVADARIDSWSARQDLRRELIAHFEDAGTSPDAIADALRRFGSAPGVTRRLRAAHRRRPAAWIADVRQDIRAGWRQLRRQPGFALLAACCLTLAIGANAAVLSWIEGILLRPYPLVVGQDRMFAVTGTMQGTGERTAMSWLDFQDLARSSTLAERFVAEKISGSTMTLGGRAERVPGSVVSANYFDAIGVRPVVGRGFRPEEDVGRNAHAVAVISYDLWQRRFSGDGSVIGQTLMLNGLPFTVIGVAPEGFYGTFVGYALQFWVPASMQGQFDVGVYKLEDRGAQWIEGFVRLKPGVTLAEAQSEFSAIASRLAATYPTTNRGRGVRLYPLWQTPFNGASFMLPTLGVALIGVIAVLLTSCANVGNLLLVRAVARQREMTIRLALGAGRGRLVRQLLTEAALLAALSAAGGLVVAIWCRDAVAYVVPLRGVPLHLTGDLDWRVVAVATTVCLSSTLAFALVPAVLASRTDLAGALRASTGSLTAHGRRTWARSAFVLVQVSLSFVLLVGASLLLLSLDSTRRAEPGFAADGLTITSVDLFTAGYDDQRARIFQDELLERLRNAGLSAALSRLAPFTFRSFSSASIGVDGVVSPPDEQPTAEYDEVSPGFLATVGIPIVAGRDFTRADDETRAPVVIVDQTLVSQFWPAVDPVGRRLRVDGREALVVGVAGAARFHDLIERPRPFFYVPLRQRFSPTVAVLVRSPQDSSELAPVLLREIRALDSDLAPGEIITMREQIARTAAPQQAAVVVLTAFGTIALVLAAVGLYGVMAASVAQRARELALRTALGAAGSDLLRQVMSRGLTLTAGGLAIGLAIALGSTRLLGYLLYQVSPYDPGAFAAACAAIVGAAIVACLLPAWRALRADPAAVLKSS